MHADILPCFLSAGSARCAYAQRKAELLGSSNFTYNLESSLHQGPMTEYISPGSARRDTLKNRNSGPQSPGSTGHLYKATITVTLLRSCF